MPASLSASSPNGRRLRSRSSPESKAEIPVLPGRRYHAFSSPLDSSSIHALPFALSPGRSRSMMSPASFDSVLKTGSSSSGTRPDS